jgi:ABC-type lipoprotein release transport system permease subunit
MKEYLKIAWRNLWRNRRRTMITVTSVLFAVFLALMMRSMQLGSYAYMIESALKNSTGYLQVHARGYWADKSIDNSLEFNPELEARMKATGNISSAVPRLESFALISSGRQTKGVAVIGTDPALEDQVSGLKKRIISGNYLEPGQYGVLLSEGLASYMAAGVNDSIVLLGQGYHGVTAAAELPVVGIVRFVQPDMNNQLLYMDLGHAQEFYSAENRLTSVSLMLNDPDRMLETAGILNEIDPEKLEVMTWKEMLFELVQYIESDNISGLFMLGILYMVVGFGILGTILMMTRERRREFGIMVAVGMKRTILATILMIESLIITIIGLAGGVALSLPVLTWFYHHPIQLKGEMAEAVLEYNMEPVMPFSMDPSMFYNQSFIVLIITLVALIYPLSVIARFKVIHAIKNR